MLADRVRIEIEGYRVTSNIRAEDVLELVEGYGARLIAAKALLL